MKKNKEWAFIELGKLFPSHAEMHDFPDNITVTKCELLNKVYDILSQLEEPEVKQLERKIKELDSYNDELIRDNNQLREALSDQYCHNLEIEIDYDEKIKSLEYELFVEKTRDSEHKFYWFTAKKTPLIVDISYMSNESHFYGFKQVPNYHFIENHDLRFVTNCSLDDLVEQFR